MSTYDVWDQCEACGKMCLLSDLNEEGLCPNCSAEMDGALDDGEDEDE